MRTAQASELLALPSSCQVTVAEVDGRVEPHFRSGAAEYPFSRIGETKRATALCVVWNLAVDNRPVDNRVIYGGVSMIFPRASVSLPQSVGDSPPSEWGAAKPCQHCIAQRQISK